MQQKSEIVVKVGFSSEIGPREENQDFGGFHQGSPLERVNKGSIAAVADGVSGGKEGRVAAELAVRQLIDGFYTSPDTLGTAKAMHDPLAAYNRWLHTQGQGFEMTNSATTLTALAMRGRTAHIVHTGDSRAWRMAHGKLTCLTTDHVRPEPDLQHVLIRALGIEAEVRLDHLTIELAQHDRLLLTTDGVHGSLSNRKIEAILAEQSSAEATAEKLTSEAHRSGSQDNATALVLDIVTLPPPDHEGILADLASLPFQDPPKIGEAIDGFEITRVLSEGRYAILLVARDGEDGDEVVLKFPRKQVLSERAMHLAFAREMLISRRVSSPYILGAHTVRPDRQSALYGVMPFIRGETMEARLKNGLPTLSTALDSAIKLTRGVAALHRLHVIHRDIKPENVMLTEDGGLQLIDLGVSRLPRIEDFREDEIPGTPGFMAPEQFLGNAGDEQTDIFALGVTLYRLFTGQWPFGEQEAFQRPRFGRPAPLSRHRPETPSWLDDAIINAIQPDTDARYVDVIELLRKLEGGGSLQVQRHGGVPLIERDPVRFWQAVSALLTIALLTAVIWR